MNEYTYFATFNGMDEVIDGRTAAEYEDYCNRWYAYRDGEPPSFEVFAYWHNKWDAEYDKLWDDWSATNIMPAYGIPRGVAELEYWCIA